MEFEEFVGEIREFKRATLTELGEIKKDVKALNNFKWRVAGGSALLVLILTIAVQAIQVWFH